MANGGSRARHRRAGAPNQAELGIECTNRGDDGCRERSIGLGLVVERAVRLDVMEEGPCRLRDRIELAELVEEKAIDFGDGQLHRASPKSFPIVVARVGSDGDPVPLGQRHRQPHRVRIAGVASAGDVGRGHDPKKRFVAFGISLTDVSVQVELPHALILRRNPAAGVDG